MKDLEDSKKIVVLIDADNAQYTKLSAILSEVSAHGHIVCKRAYGDWSSDYLKNWKTILNELAIQPVQQFAYTQGKNSTDASMIIDAMDLLYSEKYDAFVIVSSDSDFTKLASRLRESEMYVFGVGEKKTPISFKNACDDFILTENLFSDDSSNTEKTVITETNNIESEQTSLIPILTKGWEKYQDEDGWANTAAVGSYIKRQLPEFDPRTYGEPKLTRIIEKLKEFEMKTYPGKGKATIKAYRLKN